jgi:hypothetical protein
MPSPALGARVLALVDDPDPVVRRELVLLLGNPALAGAAASERVRALEHLALQDPSEFVRSQALAALGECGLEAAVPALDRALERLPADEAEQAAAGLTKLALGRARLIRRLSAPSPDASAGPDGAASGRLPDGVHAALLSGYGRALAEVPGGGEGALERLPFLRGRTHPALAVQLAARTALANFVARAAELSESERAEHVLARLGEEGWPPVECLRRALDLAWLERGDAAGGLELARALGRAAQVLSPEEAAAWEPRARILEGAALYALGRAGEAARLFDELGARLDAGRARRDDLFPSPLAREWTEAGGAVEIDRLHLAALVHLWRALLALDSTTGDVRVLEELRAAHALFLRSRLVALRTRANDPDRLDALFERDLAPHTLLLFNEKLAPLERGQALDRAVRLARCFGQVAPLELMGLEGEAPRRALGDVFLDPERLALIKALRAAHRRELERRLDEGTRNPWPAADEEARANQRFIWRQLLQQSRRDEDEEERALREVEDPARLTSAELRRIYAGLLDFLTPSMHAHALAGHLRAENRTGEARALCERALATLRTSPLGSSFWSELSSARFEILRGSTLMDEGRAPEAEETFLAAERRLAAIETQMEERGAAAADPDLARQYQAQASVVRELRGDALLSLAVNANVRMGKPARALEYFERAYALNQSPFMRILRACYRARSGKHDEARTVLASVTPVPSLYYNIACTHALLGDEAEALDYLERDLAENHPSAGSLAQKKAWARKDPDLASLRGEPRFERLFGERGN